MSTAYDAARDARTPALIEPRRGPAATPEQTYVLVAPPRSASTALARLFWHHDDIRFYAHEPYGARFHDRAGSQSVDDALSRAADLDLTIGGKPAGSKGLTIKEMSFQVGDDFALLASRTTNPIVFNVRDPRLCMRSRMVMRERQGLSPLFPARESGWEDLERQIGWCREVGYPYRIVDSDSLRGTPGPVASALFRSLDLPFQPSVLDWTPADPETVRVVAEQHHWYERVMESNGLEAATEPIPAVEFFPTTLGLRAHVVWSCEIFQRMLKDPHVIRAPRDRQR